MTQGVNRCNHGRKNQLLKEGKITCLICPLHKAENNLNRRRPKSDKGKNHRRVR